MKIGLLGVTGGVGARFAKLVLARGHTVVALARTPPKVSIKNARLIVIKGDSTNAEAVADFAASVDVVVSCVGQPPRAATHIMERTVANILEGKPARIVYVSSLGLCGSSPLIRYVLLPIAGSANIRDAENADRLCSNASTTWTVVRPAGLSDGAGKGRYQATLSDGASFSPISREDVALFLADEVENPKFERVAVQLYAA